MKLAFVLLKYFPYGGLERDFVRIALECQQRGHTIDVFSMIWEGELPKGFHLHLITTSGMSNHKRVADFAKQLYHKLAKHHYDLVIGFNKLPYLDVYYAADPCYEAKVSLEHGHLYRLGKRYKVYSAMEKAVFLAENKVQLLFIAKTQIPYFQKYYHTPDEVFHLLPPGIDISRVRPDNAQDIRRKMRKQLGIREEDKLLLMIGSGYKRKGVDRSFKALASLPQFLREKTQLLIAGEDNIDKYQRLAKKLGIKKQVILPGARKDIPELLLASDIFLHPARHENTGTVLLEAIVAGIPQLVSGICGYAFHVKAAKAGVVLKEPFVQKQFNQKLLKVLTSDKWQIWQDNALAYMRTHDLFSMPEKAVDIIEKTAKKNKKANIYTLWDTP